MEKLPENNGGEDTDPAIPTPAVMESKDPLPPAKNLLPKPPESKTPFQFQTVTNQPSERRRKRPRPADTEQETDPNTPATKPVPKSTFYHQRKRAETAATSQDTERRSYVRKATYNMCKQCKQPKTAEYGHGRYTGEFGTDTFCPAVEGKQYPSKEAWLEAQKKENPAKKKKV